MTRLLIVGLDELEVEVIRSFAAVPLLVSEMLPRIQIREEGKLYSEHESIYGRFVPVSHVLFHGIFENDLHFLAAMALWNGPCFPTPLGMMDCRQRIPGLVRALRVTKFGSMWRGFGDQEVSVNLPEGSVAKWGEWHCGENKARVTEPWQCNEPTLFEPFIEGEAVRIQLIGEQAWQIHMQGDAWLKSIHHPQSTIVPTDLELLEDTRAIQKHFHLDVIAVDYMIGQDGTKHLLEVNHIPSVTAFEEMRTAYLKHVQQWMATQGLTR